MKCPNCGQWNRASLPVCQKCATPLIQSTQEDFSWRGTLQDSKKGKEYIRVNEEGEAASTPDHRETLAQEMSDLKVRKAIGREHQRQLRANGASRGAAPSSRDVRFLSGADQFWQNENMPGGTRPYPLTADEEEDALRQDSYWGYEEYSARHHQVPTIQPTVDLSVQLPSRRRGLRKLLRALTILLIVVLLGLAGFFGYHFFENYKATKKEQNAAFVTASIQDDLAAHTIMIPGEDGNQIYIRELHTSYMVTGGFATIVVADHIWYDDHEDFLGETMDVTLTPFLKTAFGQQKPMDPVTYTIEIPLSPIELITPDSFRHEVSTAMYSMKFKVRPGTKVTVNGRDCSDTVSSETGELTYNATVQPIGDNTFTVVARSQYCRENIMTVTLYREPQEIPLDLAADTYTSTSMETMRVNATTIPGAHVEVESPHYDLDITNVDSTGAFSFYAKFDHIGYNTITITSAMPGKKTSVVNYEVYYLPSADKYTPRAWKLDEAGYSELLSNIQVRVERTQIYVVMGTVQYEVSAKPQMVVINTSEDGLSRPVLLENFTKTEWEVGKYYRIYADAYGTYNGMPRLAARYTYDK